MATGRTFKESFKRHYEALRLAQPALIHCGMISRVAQSLTFESSSGAGARRAWYIADAFRQGLTRDEVQQHTGIDPWFLAQIQELVEAERVVEGQYSTIEKTRCIF